MGETMIKNILSYLAGCSISLVLIVVYVTLYHSHGTRGIWESGEFVMTYNYDSGELSNNQCHTATDLQGDSAADFVSLHNHDKQLEVLVSKGDGDKFEARVFRNGNLMYDCARINKEWLINPTGLSSGNKWGK
jgi:hypothetical protein